MPTYVDKLMERAAAALRAGRFEEAEAALGKASAIEPSNAAVAHLRGVARRAGSDLAGAVEHFARAVGL